MAEASDFLDGILNEWGDEIPGLDIESLGAAMRIRRLANYFEKRADVALAPLGLTLWQFEVLAALQLRSARDGIHACDLLPTALLSPGAMTNRLDRLEQAGWIERLPDPSDRRAVRVRLTAAGHRLARRATQARSAEAAQSVSGLTPAQRSELASHLRSLLRSLCPVERSQNTLQL